MAVDGYRKLLNHSEQERQSIDQWVKPNRADHGWVLDRCAAVPPCACRQSISV